MGIGVGKCFGMLREVRRDEGKRVGGDVEGGVRVCRSVERDMG